MNTERLRELLAAAASGDLSGKSNAGEKREVERLLRESESARALFQKLKADATRLAKLPRRPAPTDTADRILNRIREGGLKPTPLPSRHASQTRWVRLPIWAAYFSAASVLALVFLGSFAYFSLSQEFKNRQAAEIAKNSKTDKKADQPAAVSVTPPEGSAVVVLPKDDVKVVASNDKPYTPEAAPLPREIEAPLTAPSPNEMPEINPLQLDKFRLSKFFTPAEIAREPGMTDKLLAELKKDELIRADLFCVSPAKTLEQLTAAMSSNGIHLIVDANLKERIRRNQPTEVVLFVDSMTPADMVKLFTRVSQEVEKKGTAELDTLVVAPFMPTDLTKLGRLLGASNVFPKVPAPKSPVDIRKPLPDGTASEIAKSLSKMGNSSGNPAKADQVAIALAYSPMNANPANSREVRTFLDRRGGDRKPETKPLMLVLLASK